MAEQIADHVLALIPQVKDAAVLLKAAVKLDLDVPEERQQNRRAITRQLMTFLNDDDLKDKDDIEDKLSGVYEDLNNHLNPDPAKSDSDDEQKPELGNDNSPKTPVQPATTVVPMKVHRFKEFKIHGEIGEPPVEGQKTTKKNELTYSNISFQIKNGLEDKYKDREICAAVIRAVTAQDLRGYLEERIMEDDLDLQGLRNILKTHFKVKDATAVFNELVTMVQKVGENEMNFTTKMMDLRKKVVRLSKEEGGNYTQSLVQQQFQKSLYSGLRPGSIRQGLRQLLRTTEMKSGGKHLKTVSDDVLREEISELMLNEAEHTTKTSTSKKSTSVNKVTFKDGDSEEMEESGATQKKTKVNLAQIAKKMDDRFVQFTKDMENLKTEVRNKMTPAPEMEDDYIDHGNGAYADLNVNGGRGSGGYGRGYRGYHGYRGQGGRGNGRGYGSGRGNGFSYRGGGGRGGGRSGRGGGRGWFGYRDGYIPRRCQICTDAKAVGCNHCFTCGEVTHKDIDCPTKNEPRS